MNTTISVHAKEGSGMLVITMPLCISEWSPPLTEGAGTLEDVIRLVRLMGDIGDGNANNRVSFPRPWRLGVDGCALIEIL